MSQPFGLSIIVSFTDGAPSSYPNPAVIPDASSDGTVTITWIPKGCTITNIVWTAVDQPPANPAPLPNSPNPGSPNWFVSYMAPNAQVSWNYTVYAAEGDVVRHDPEIDNVIP